MALSNHNIYKSQLLLAIEKYPNLTIEKVGDKEFLKGILDIPTEDLTIADSFLVEIHFSEGFPYRFPTLYEVGGTIPNEADWHKYVNSSCCISVESDEILKCKNGITVNTFISDYAIPFFANYLYRKITGSYKNGEYSHGKQGYIEFYTELLKTQDTALWAQYFNNTFRNYKYPKERNKKCFCGSDTKFKKCHLLAFEKLVIIGEHKVLNHFKSIFNFVDQ